MIYRGHVTRVDSTNKRIRATVPALFGSGECNWADPCITTLSISTSDTVAVGDHGSHSHGTHTHTVVMPEVGDTVWLAFEDAGYEHAVWLGVRPA